MTYTQKKYLLLKGIPIAALLTYIGLSLMAGLVEPLVGSRFIWGIPFGFGLLALILGEPIRQKLGLSFKWLAAYTRSLGALYAATAFANALL